MDAELKRKARLAQLREWVRSLPLKRREALVLEAMCVFVDEGANGSTVLWPSVAKIARLARCSPRTVERALVGLSAPRAAGAPLVGIEERPGRSTRYTLFDPRQIVRGGGAEPARIGLEPPTDCQDTPDRLSQPPLPFCQDTPDKLSDIAVVVAGGSSTEDVAVRARATPVDTRSMFARMRSVVSGRKTG